MTSRRLAAIVLAAGLSERMAGQIPKQLLPLGDTTMVGRVAAAALRAGLDPVIVVAGNRADDVERALEDSPATVVVNPDYRTGNVGSLRTGLAAVGERTPVVLLLADMPGVSAGTIAAVAEAWGRKRPFAAAASYHDGVGHPFVLSAEAVRGAARLEGSKPLWSWLREEHARDVLLVPIDTAKPRDVNTWEDYEAVVAELGSAEPAAG